MLAKDAIAAIARFRTSSYREGSFRPYTEPDIAGLPGVEFCTQYFSKGKHAATDVLIPSILDLHGVLDTYMLAKGLQHTAENAIGFYQQKVVYDGNDRWVTAMSTIQVVIIWQARYIAYDQCSPEIFRVGQV